MKITLYKIIFLLSLCLSAYAQQSVVQIDPHPLINKQEPMYGQPLYHQDVNLVGSYLLNEGQGFTVKDSSGYEQHGLFAPITYNIDWQSQLYGWVVNFYNGAITIPKSDILDLDKQFTLAVWLRFDAKVTTCYIINTYQSVSPAGRHITIHTDGSGLGNVIKANIDDNANPTIIISTQVLLPKVWYHVCLTRNYGVEDFRLYIDGKLVESETDITTGTVVSDQSWRIGRRSVAAGEYFNGRISSFQFYNRSLSQFEIQRLVANTFWQYEQEPLWGIIGEEAAGSGILSILENIYRSNN